MSEDMKTTKVEETNDNIQTEEFKVSGEAIVGKLKGMIREGNIRRITIKNDDGKVLMEIPLTIGVVGTVLLPVWAAIGAMAALVANFTITIERKEAVKEANEPVEQVEKEDS